MRVTDVTNFLGITNTKRQEVKTPIEIQHESEPEGERTILYSWTALSRPHKMPMSQKTVKTMIIIGVVVSLLLVAMQEFFLILGIGSLIFVSYMLTKIPPEEVKYEITNHGINYNETFYYWRDLKQFFFMAAEGMNVLAVDLMQGVPARLFLTMKPGDEEKLKKLLGEHVLFLEKEPKTLADRAYDSVVSKINLG